MRVAFYGRLSDDKDGSSTGIDRQRYEANALCEAKGWRIVVEYVDSDLSAFQRHVKRPQFEQMLLDAGNGDFDLILTWKLDRLVRRIAEFGRIWSILDDAKVGLASVKDSFDTSTTVGLIIVNVLVGIAQMESENISIREKAKHAELIRQGRAFEGGKRGFGHTMGRRDVVPEEAQLIREAAEAIVGGVTLHSIERDWQKRGVVSPAGKPWRRGHLRRMFLSPRLIGRRTEDGPQGETAPILDEDVWRAVSGILTAPGRFRSGYAGRRWLLSGFLLCGKCNTKLRSKYREQRKDGRYGRRYACDACYSVLITAEPMEDALVDTILNLLDHSDIPQIVPADNSMASLRADEAALIELTRSRYVDRIITDAEFLPARQALTERIASAQRKMAPTPAVMMKGKAHAVWESADLDQRRSIVSAVIDHIVVLPAKRRGVPFDPERLQIHWRA